MDPAHGFDAELDILVQDNKIAGLAPHLPRRGVTVFDASGLLVVPGLVDVHVHFREPGDEEKEDLQTGAKAAAAGGFTTVVCQPNTDPPIDRQRRVRWFMREAREKAIVRLHTAAAMTMDLAGKKLTNVRGLKEAGAVAITDDGHPVQKEDLMQDACKAAAACHMLVSPHCEESKLRPIGHPQVKTDFAQEAGLVKRDTERARRTGCHLHISHVSLGQTVGVLKRQKSNAVMVTAEVTPHHLTLSSEDEERIGPNAKVNPPLRTKEDVQVLRRALKADIIDIIATDHAPHTPEEKSRGWKDAPHGIIGLETAFSVIHTELVLKKDLSLQEAIRKMSFRPAQIFGLLPAGQIGVGLPADLTLIDLDRKWVVDPEQFFSKARNCPFAGSELCGKVVMTLVGGQSAYTDPVMQTRMPKRTSRLQETLGIAQ